ncbi:MAG: polysaccharide (de)acetylase [Ignavibacteria bacterium]|jgi:hypothetical protein
MFKKLRRELVNNLKNIPGWKTDRKIVVIESDDWGSIRMPSKHAYNDLLKFGIDLTSGDAHRYNLYDSLATEDDLISLFDVLTSFKDHLNNHPKFTVVSVVANPDFEKIEQNNFEKYFYEPFTETLKKYPRCENSFSLWQQGISEKIFIPQFHGREHLNVYNWLKDLRNGDTETLYAFKYKMWGFRKRNKNDISYQAAFDLKNINELKSQSDIIIDGLGLFYKLHKYKAQFFVPPNGPFNSSLKSPALDGGIKYISTPKIHYEPVGEGRTKRSFHWIGQKNKLGQLYLTRNCFFEPSNNSKDWVDSCLSDIQYAFKWKKPAVISSHRVNYIGALDVKNRDNGIKNLRKLISSILKRWPDAEFMTSDELGNLISGNK